MKKMILNSEIWASAMRDKVFENVYVSVGCDPHIYWRQVFPLPVP